MRSLPKATRTPGWQHTSWCSRGGGVYQQIKGAPNTAPQSTHPTTTALLRPNMVPDRRPHILSPALGVSQENRDKCTPALPQGRGARGKAGHVSKARWVSRGGREKGITDRTPSRWRCCGSPWRLRHLQEKGLGVIKVQPHGTPLCPAWFEHLPQDQTAQGSRHAARTCPGAQLLALEGHPCPRERCPTATEG